MQVLDHITDGEQYELEFVGRFTDMLYLLGSSLMVVLGVGFKIKIS